MQALYRWLIAGGAARPIANECLEGESAAGIDRDYFRELTTVGIDDSGALDALLARHLDRPVVRLDAVEHAVLLTGAVELRDHPELAVSIVTNEAVELARTFGAEGGHRYVNGVLDKLAAELRSRATDPGDGGNG